MTTQEIFVTEELASGATIGYKTLVTIYTKEEKIANAKERIEYATKRIEKLTKENFKLEAMKKTLKGTEKAKCTRKINNNLSRIRICQGMIKTAKWTLED